MECGLVNAEELDKLSDGADCSHALAAGFKSKVGDQGGQSGRCGGRNGRGGTGCPNWLRIVLARISVVCLLVLTIPAGSRVAWRYEPLLLRGDTTLVPIICAPDVSKIIKYVR